MLEERLKAIFPNREFIATDSIFQRVVDVSLELLESFVTFEIDVLSLEQLDFKGIQILIENILFLFIYPSLGEIGYQFSKRITVELNGNIIKFLHI